MARTDFRPGFIGLGIIGTALSTNLLADGYEVIGFDVDPARIAEHVDRGGRPARDVAGVAADADVIFVAVATTNVLAGVAGELAAAPRNDDAVVVDLGTLPLAEKVEARDILGAADVTLLDCTISGTGAQAAARDLVFMASGDPDTIERIQPLLAELGREVYDVGAFGNGIKMKFIANHLVAVHNTAAAEALVLAERSGLDLDQVLDVIGSGAGSSRMFEVRGPMIAHRAYQDPTARVSLFAKDIALIAQHAGDVDSPTPLFDVTAQLYRAAVDGGLGDYDAAAVVEAIEARANPASG